MFDCILLMAGKGSRLNLNVNKALYPLGDKPLYFWSLEKFLKIKECEKVILVVAEGEKDLVDQEIRTLNSERIVITTGGKTRQESVSKGFKCVNSKYILIHDAARPFITEEDILKVYSSTKTYGAAVIATLVKDSIKEVNNGFISQSISRDKLYAVQTPQGIKSSIYQKAIIKAASQNYVGTDDVELVEKFTNNPINIVLGTDTNFKITTIKDLQIAKMLIEEGVV